MNIFENIFFCRLPPIKTIKKTQRHAKSILILCWTAREMCRPQFRKNLDKEK